MNISAQDVVDFWRSAGEAGWFNADAAFDALCHERFLALHLLASRNELEHWSQDPTGSLALLILLDQLPRNIFRGSAHAYATDPMARAVAYQALSLGFDQQFTPELRSFFYLPLMHSEILADQQYASKLFQTLDTPRAIKWRTHHLAIIKRFGRFPHRNRVLGRNTTPNEQAWLDEGGFQD
ncbi:DUF924 family protein [Alcaligenaceae bacterium CGII-47]|nr:DUF924 family protein [Alcaligenaceae bacterium CGII-47]